MFRTQLKIAFNMQFSIVSYNQISWKKFKDMQSELQSTIHYPKIQPLRQTYFLCLRGLRVVSKETIVLCLWGVETNVWFINRIDI